MSDDIKCQYMWEPVSGNKDAVEMHLDYRLSEDEFKLLKMLPGISSAYMDELYSFVLVKGKLFNWNEIKQSILKFLSRKGGTFQEMVMTRKGLEPK